ncbi:MAG: alpha/beta hydrolase [Bacteroidota bacterium]
MLVISGVFETEKFTSSQEFCIYIVGHNMMKHMTEKYTEKSNQKTFYWTSGSDGVCVLVIHGATADHKLFKHQFHFFEKHFEIVAVDIPAHGKSKPYLNFNLKTAADEIIKILDLEKIEKTHLIGQSMGGYISQIVARFYPNRVKSIITIGSSPIQPKYYSRLDNWLLKITPTILKAYPYHMLIKAIANQVSSTNEGKKYMLETLKGYTKNEIVTIMKEVYVGIQEYRENKALNVPILLTYGDSDRTGKVQAYNKKWAKNENLRLEIIPNAAHNANMDNSIYFNDLAKEFIEGIENTVPNKSYM